jgi:hypothetical protein
LGLLATPCAATGDGVKGQTAENVSRITLSFNKKLARWTLSVRKNPLSQIVSFSPGDGTILPNFKIGPAEAAMEKCIVRVIQTCSVDGLDTPVILPFLMGRGFVAQSG